MCEVVQNGKKTIKVMTSPSVDRQICFQQIIFFEFSPVTPTNTMFISVDAVLYLYSAVISRLSDFFFPFNRQNICKHIVLILRFNAY